MYGEENLSKLPENMNGLDRLDRSPSLKALKERIANIERHGRIGKSSDFVASTGFSEVDRMLPDGGLPKGMVHEVSGHAADGFVLQILSRLKGAVLWCVGQGQKGEWLYGPGLFGCGLRIENLLICQAGNTKQCLWAMEEALRSNLLAAVIGEPGGRVDLTASRRLQLAAERGKTLGLVISGRQHHRHQETILSPSAVFSRWHVTPSPSRHGEALAWDLRLLRYRGTEAAQWRLSL